MKININIQNIFRKLDDEDVAMSTDSGREGSINEEKIKKETLRRVREEKTANSKLYSKKFSKVAMVAVMILCLSGFTYVTASEEVKIIISELLGISKTEVLAIGESVQNKDYKLTVIDITSDTNTGWVTVSVEAISEDLKENFKEEDIINKFVDIGHVGYSICELEELATENIRYFSFSFYDINKQKNERKLVFSLEGIRKKVKVVIPQTTMLEKVNISVPATEEHQVVFHKMEYSELGFMIYGTLKNVTEDNVSMEISLEFLDGSSSGFFHSITNNRIEFDNEWFSGSGNYIDDKGNYVEIYTFSKKMDWSSIKAIKINGTEVFIR
ncbi:hypothetical protein [Anaerosporobacter sp.]|uniref:hypothetical protein n=1 Tax=Anaerosporobacter sp. TaxID=1872529 RepID=UPI00286F07AF|nr:hypothetical protein [Anaerosporobacter sp.]